MRSLLAFFVIALIAINGVFSQTQVAQLSCESNSLDTNLTFENAYIESPLIGKIFLGMDVPREIENKMNSRIEMNNREVTPVPFSLSAYKNNGIEIGWNSVKRVVYICCSLKECIPGIGIIIGKSATEIDRQIGFTGEQIGLSRLFLYYADEYLGLFVTFDDDGLAKEFVLYTYI